jgi:hypothetical protein
MHETTPPHRNPQRIIIINIIITIAIATFTFTVTISSTTHIVIANSEP